MNLYGPKISLRNFQRIFDIVSIVLTKVESEDSMYFKKMSCMKKKLAWCSYAIIKYSENVYQI